jgi:hypothetical protein
MRKRETNRKNPSIKVGVFYNALKYRTINVTVKTKAPTIQALREKVIKRAEKERIKNKE